jgi:hypothetical protein
MVTKEKVRENRVRRMAQRQGLRLERSRSRDPQTDIYGTYHLVDPNRNLVLWGDRDAYGLSLDEIEIALRDKPKLNCKRQSA